MFNNGIYTTVIVLTFLNKLFTYFLITFEWILLLDINKFFSKRFDYNLLFLLIIKDRKVSIHLRGGFP